MDEVLDGSTTCSFCRGPSDVFGEHALCRKKTEFYTPHLAVVEFLTKYIRAAGVKVGNEVQIGNRQRPADLLLTRWTGERPLAVIPPVAELSVQQTQTFFWGSLNLLRAS